MLHKLRRRMQDEQGFTLIELLVVILIIGILAAIAIPAFLNQTAKANDSAAKSQLNTAATTMQTCATDNSGSYVGCSTATLQSYEPTLKNSAGSPTFSVVGTPSASAYTLQSVVPSTSDTFYYTENAGVESRSCVSTNAAPANGGCVSGSW